MCFRFHLTDFSDDAVDLHREVERIYDAYHLNEDGESVGGKAKMRFLREGGVPFTLRGGSAEATDTVVRGLCPLLVALAALYKEHYRWFEPMLLEASRSGADDKPATAHKTPIPFQEDADYEQPDDDDEEAQLLTLPVITTPQDPVDASPTLNHQRVLAVFRASLRKCKTDADPHWIDDPKQPDQFVSVKNYLWQQDTDWVRSSKRPSDDESLDSNKPAKRSRGNSRRAETRSSPGTPQLGSIAERAEGED